MFVGDEARSFLKRIWPDFNTEKADVVLHEKPSGYAGTHLAVRGLTEKLEQWGVRQIYGVAVTGYDMAGGQIVAKDVTSGRLPKSTSACSNA